MTENPTNQNLQEEKPVNINISFNINRKQVNKNLNSFQQENSYNLKNNITDDNDTNSKAKNSFYKLPKTPELAQTDRSLYSKDLEYLRPTEELKRKKKRKRSTGDFQADKTSNFPFYPNQLQKNQLNHKRGYTTVLTNKKSSTGTKPKKSCPRTQDNLRQHRGSSGFIDYSKNIGTQIIKPSEGLQKNLKHMINKLINTQLSKRSLPLPMVTRKSKYNISQSLTNQKIRTTGKKKSSKSIISAKQKGNYSLNYPKYSADKIHENQVFPERIDSAQHNQGMDNLLDRLHRKQFLEKLSSFKSVENSYLLSQLDRQEQGINKNKSIVIKTDQSMDCIGEIHRIEMDKFGEFFEEKDTRESFLKRSNETAQIIQTYINLLNQSKISINLQQDHHENKKRIFGVDEPELAFSLQIPSDDYLHDPNIHNISQRMLYDRQSEQNNINRQQLDKSVSKQKVKDFYNPEDGIKIVPNDYFGTTDRQQINYKNVGLQINLRLESENEHARFNNCLQEQLQQGGLKPFMSAELVGQESGHAGSLVNQEDRSKLNEIKKQEIEKWGYLLEFIKSNISKQANTQEVLEEVYLYLQSAKKDLQKQGQHMISALKNSGLKEYVKDKREFSEQFTNKLSSKFSKSSQKYRNINQHEVNNEEYQIQDVNSEARSFKQDYNQDDSIRHFNLSTIESALRGRVQVLGERKAREILLLEERLDNGKISVQEFEEEKQRIQKWIDRETNQILKAKRNIWKGYNQAKGILDKSRLSRDPEEASSRSNQKKMMKCLSQNYLSSKKAIDYRKLIAQDGDKQSKVINIEGKDNKDIQKQIKEKESQNQKIQQIKIQCVLPLEQEIPAHQSFESGDLNFFSVDSGDLDPLSSKIANYEQLQKELYEGSDNEDFYKLKQKQHEGSESQDESRTKILKVIPVQKQNPIAPNPLYKKLKFLTDEDREDIFEFLFLDLCIEIYQQPCKDNKFMQLINGHIAKLALMAKRKKGVKTNLNVVKDYLKRFCGYLTRTSKNILNNLNVPMGPTAIEMLRYMHENDEIQEEPIEQGEGMVTLIIPIQLFDTFQRSLLPTLEFQKYYDDQNKQTERVNFLKNILHIHNKALFDALNEFLDHQRPFGIWGKPFPWKKTSSFSHKFSEAELEQKLKKSAQRVVESCSYVCGLLVDKQQSLIGSAKLTSGYIQQIRQDRISRMLANDMIQNQDRWVFYDDEETQVLVQAGQALYNRLIKQCIDQLKVLTNRQI